MNCKLSKVRSNSLFLPFVFVALTGTALTISFWKDSRLTEAETLSRRLVESPLSAEQYRHLSGQLDSMLHSLRAELSDVQVAPIAAEVHLQRLDPHRALMEINKMEPTHPVRKELEQECERVEWVLLNCLWTHDTSESDRMKVLSHQLRADEVLFDLRKHGWTYFERTQAARAKALTLAMATAHLKETPPSISQWGSDRPGDLLFAVVRATAYIPGSRDFEETIADIDKRIPNNPYILRMKAQKAAWLHRDDEALALYDEAFRIGKNLASNCLEVARLWMRKKRPELAREILAWARDQYGHYPDAEAELAWMQNQLGDPKGAEVALNRMIVRHPDSVPPAHVYYYSLQNDPNQWRSAIYWSQQARGGWSRNPYFEKIEMTLRYKLGQYQDVLNFRSRGAFRHDPEAHLLFARASFQLSLIPATLEELNNYFRLQPPPYDAEAQMLRVRCMTIQGKNQEAKDELDKILETNPMSFEAYISRGELHFSSRDYLRAFNDFARAGLVKPQSAEAWFWAGESLYRQQPDDPDLWSKIVRFYTDAINLGCTFEEAFLHRAEANSKLDDPKAAIPDLEQAVKINNRAKTQYDLGIAYIKTNRFSEGRKSIEQALLLDPGMAQAYFFRGSMKYYLDRDPEGGIADITRAIELGYKDAECYFVRSRCRQQLIDFNGSLEDLEEVIRLKPDHDGARLARAELYLNQGRLKECISDCARLLESDARAVELHIMKSTAEARGGDFVEARGTLQKAIGLMPEKSELYEQLMHVEVGAKRIQPALSAIDKAIDLAPERVLYRLHRAYLLLQENQPVKAAADADWAVERAPNHVQSLELSAQAHGRLKNWETVISRLRLVLQAEGHKGELWLLYAQAHIGRADPVSATEAARKALANGAPAADVHQVIGEAFVLRSELSDAEQEFTQAIQANPEFGRAYLRRGEIRKMLDLPGAKEDLLKAKTLLPSEAPYIELLLGK